MKAKKAYKRKGYNKFLLQQEKLKQDAKFEYWKGKKIPLNEAIIERRVNIKRTYSGKKVKLEPMWKKKVIVMPEPLQRLSPKNQSGEKFVF